MATGARRRSNSTYAISITGVAGPTADKAPVGTMYVGIADAAGVQVMHRQFLGDRQRIRVFTCQMALDLLRRRMAKAG
jgi:nicotinamide mononucleotide (NMN) deamidase PncC